MKIIKYPDSQINVQIEDSVDRLKTVKYRIDSYEDLFVLKSFVEARNHYYGGLMFTKLFIPCLFGQRSDRRFQEHESFGLKVICDFINSMNFSKVEIFDSHSDVSLALINNSVKISSKQRVEETVLEISRLGVNTTRDLVLISPDAGAYKKVFKYAEDLSLPLVAANKFRDLKGEVTLNILGDVKGKNCLIVDDILDGGFTFHLLAKQLKEQGANKVYLYISHAYFNKGINFSDYIDHFYCTNSVKNIEDPKVTQFKII